MEITLAVIISIVSVILSILNFAYGRKDKSNKDSSDTAYKQGEIETKIDYLTKQVDKILLILDSYDKEIDEKIEKAIKHHVLEFHSEKKD